MVVGLGVAAQLVHDNDQAATGDLQRKRDILIRLLSQKCPNDSIKVNFEVSSRLPNTASLCFRGADAGQILEHCDGQVEASRSAACHTGTEGASSVLIKSGLSIEDAKSTLRLSIGRYTTSEEIKSAAEIISNAYLKCIQ